MNNLTESTTGPEFDPFTFDRADSNTMAMEYQQPGQVN